MMCRACPNQEGTPVAQRISLFLCAAVLAAIPCLAQAPGFSGTWVLDPAASEMASGTIPDIRLEVVADAKQISIVERRNTHTEHLTCSIGGEACTQNTASRGNYVLKVIAGSNGLTWTITVTRPDVNTSMTYHEQWSLSADGKTLTIHTTYPRGLESLKVFNRKP
jgi:hypothetical protein